MFTSVGNNSSPNMKDVILTNKRNNQPMNKINVKWRTGIALLVGSLTLVGCSSNKEQSQSYSSSTMYLPSFNGLTKAETTNTLGDKVIQVRKQPLVIADSNVDTNSYTNMRRAVSQNRTPIKDSVRLEGWVNYFDYGYPQPEGSAPFSVTPVIAPTPWDPETKLLSIGVKSTNLDLKKQPAMNLVILVDPSYTMEHRGGLPLMQTWLNLLTNELRPEDKLTILTYSTHPRLILKTTTGNDKKVITEAIKTLTANELIASTASIDLAYHLAKINFITGGTNRVILANSGNFNRLETNFKTLEKLIMAQKQSGISFSTIAFSFDNYDYQSMLKLSDIGGGIHAYIDTPNEANKVIKEQLLANTPVIANNLEVQVDFNPENVKQYRLLGYDRAQDSGVSRNRLYAGNIRAGYTFTVLYEMTLTDQALANADSSRLDELAFIRARYRTPGSSIDHFYDVSLLRPQIKSSLGKTNNDFRFAAAVAAFAQQFGEDKSLLNDYQLKDTTKLASQATGKDRLQLREEFVNIVAASKKLIN